MVHSRNKSIDENMKVKGRMINIIFTTKHLSGWDEDTNLCGTGPTFCVPNFYFHFLCSALFGWPPPHFCLALFTQSRCAANTTRAPSLNF